MLRFISRTLAASAVSSALVFGVSATAVAATPVTFQLNWVAGGSNAGFAAALTEGY